MISNQAKHITEHMINVGIMTEALKDKQVNHFVLHAFISSYKKNFPSHQREAEQMLQEAFKRLRQVFTKRISQLEIEIQIMKIHKEVMHGTDKNHWFLKEYLDYKRNRKPQIEMEAIKPYIKGRKILDFGSGAGFHASYLKTKGLHIDTTDVIDFRDVVANGLPFELMQTSNRIPYLDNEFDSILAIMVLHHARAQDQQSLLQDLGRIGKRLIIKETTYDLSSLDSKANSFFSEQPIFKQFVSLEVGKQKLAVSLIDLFTNAVASGWSEMSLPFQYRTIPEWKVMLAEANFKLVNIVILGFDPRQVTPDSRIIIVADKK